MSRKRWLRPLKCIESMEFYEGTEGNSYSENEKLLFEKVACSDIRAMLNDEVVSSAHIRAYLRIYDQACPDQGPYVLPPDMLLSLDDLCRVFDRALIDSRKRGRPRKENAVYSDDMRLVEEMHRMLAGHPDFPRAQSADEAARILVEQKRVSGAGTEESRKKRLVRKFRNYYTS